MKIRVLYVYRDLATQHPGSNNYQEWTTLYYYHVAYPTEKWLLSISSSLKNVLVLVGTEPQMRQNLRMCVLATMQTLPRTRRSLQFLRRKVVDGVSEEQACRNVLLWTDTVGDQSEIPIGRNKRKDSLRLPAFEPNTWMEADVIQQPWVL